MRIAGHRRRGIPHRDTAPGVPLTPAHPPESPSIDGMGRAPRRGPGPGRGLGPGWGPRPVGDRTGSPLPRYRPATGSSLCRDRDRTRVGSPVPIRDKIPAVPRPGPHRDGVPAVRLSRDRSGTESPPSARSGTGRDRLPAASTTPHHPSPVPAWSPRTPRPVSHPAPGCQRATGPGVSSLPPAGLSPGIPNPRGARLCSGLRGSPELTVSSRESRAAGSIPGMLQAFGGGFAPTGGAGRPHRDVQPNHILKT